MPTREDPIDIGTRRGERLVAEIGRAARAARHAAGLSQRQVAAVLGVSRAQLSRYERARPPLLDLRQAARLMRVLGYDLVLNTYPAAGPLRDAGHAALVARLVALLHPSIAVRLEAPIPIPRDQRAWDAWLSVGGIRIGVAAETRLRDWQALLRREQLKLRDSGADRLLLVVANTSGNLRAMREAGPSLRRELPLDGRAIRPALRGGRDPGANGILLL